MFETKYIAGFNIVDSDIEVIADSIVSWSQSSDNYRHDVHLINASSVYYSTLDEDVAEMYRKSGVLLPDGKSFSIGGTLLGKRVRQVRGPSLFGEVLSRGRAEGVRHFLLGTTDETLSKLVSKLEKKYPGVEICGTHSPTFGEATQFELVQRDSLLRASRAQVVWVGMSSPKQDFEVQRICSQLGLVAIGVGAAFDFEAGTQRQAPKLLQVSGLEWLFRLLTNPKRLWRRYLIGNFVFLKQLFTNRS